MGIKDAFGIMGMMIISMVAYLCVPLGLMFIGLKLANVITWSWVLVLSPFILLIVGGFIALIVGIKLVSDG